MQKIICLMLILFCCVARAVEPSPVVMVWLAVGDSENKFVLIGEQAYPDLAQLVHRTGQNHGIATVLPLLDLTEKLLVKASDVADFNEVPLQQAAGRYNVDVVLAGRVTKQADEWQCAWRLYADQQRIDWTTSGVDLPAEIEEMFGHLHQSLAQHYPTSKIAKHNPNAVFVRISGISDVADYAKIMNYLVGLQSVQSAAVSAVSDQEMVLSLVAEGGARAIRTALALNPLLVESTMDLASEGPSEYISYTLQPTQQPTQAGANSD
jgi:hypothetical protein